MAGVPFETVIAVAERLTRENREPTVRNVRAAVGTGSMTTISAHLERWRRARDMQTQTPPALSDAVLRALNDEIWRRAAAMQRARDAEIARLREVVETVMAESEQRACRIDDFERAAMEHERIAGQLQIVERDLAACRAELTTVRTEAEAARREAAVARAVSAQEPARGSQAPARKSRRVPRREPSVAKRPGP